MVKITIKTDTPRLYSFLAYETPIGVDLVSAPPREYKSFNIDVSVNIELVVDLYNISKVVLATWLIKQLVSKKGNHQININGKQIAIDQTEIEKELQNAIDNDNAE